MVGFMTIEGNPSFLGCLPGHPAGTPQKLNFYFQSKSDQIRHLPH
jgi:hypothetical protein